MSQRAAIEAAAARIGPHTRRTPLLRSVALSRLADAEVYLKLENLQYTGSFKVRGALNKVLSLSPADRKKGIVTASTGNHGAAVAHVLASVGQAGTVFVPQSADRSKVARIEALGGRISFVPGDPSQSETRARAVAAETGAVYISPYNDPAVVAGQGTIGPEIQEDLPAPDAVVVAVGGGGLISGIAAYLDEVSPATAIVGASPRHSAVMAESVRRGEIVELESLPTLSDGTAGGVEPGTITFEWCRTLVDEYDLIDEDAIAAAMRLVLEEEHLVIEGAAGVAVASVLARRDRWRGQRVVAIICGGNVSPETLRSVL